MGINVQINAKRRIDFAATQLVFWTLIVINSGTLIQDINFFFANEEKVLMKQLMGIDGN